jgi:hypothetical protein
MLSIIGIKKTIEQHTADMDITDSVDYKISTLSVIHIIHIGLIPLYTISAARQLVGCHDNEVTL